MYHVMQPCIITYFDKMSWNGLWQPALAPRVEDHSLPRPFSLEGRRESGGGARLNTRRRQAQKKTLVVSKTTKVWSRQAGSPHDLSCMDVSGAGWAITMPIYSPALRCGALSDGRSRVRRDAALVQEDSRKTGIHPQPRLFSL